MTISAPEYYGRSGYHYFTSDLEVFTMPAGTETRFWIMAADPEVVFTQLSLRLPDVATFRSLGWRRLTIINSMTPALGIQHSDGSPLLTLASSQVVKLGLLDRVPNSTTSWATSFKQVLAARRDDTADTFNVGSDFGLTNNAETYTHELDVWTEKDPVPLASGNPRESACSEVFYNLDTRAYFTESLFFFRFGNNSYTQYATSTVSSLFSGMSNEGTTIYKISLNSTSAERYDPIGDSWATKPAPTGLPFNNSVSADWGLRTFLPTGGARIFIMAGTPDTSNQLQLWNAGTETYEQRSLPAATFGSFAPCMTGIGARLHMHSGSFNSTVVPQYSSTYHGKYDFNVDAWSTEPVVPVVARGMGSAGLSSVVDRYTFGMGATLGYPATQTEHYRYKTLQQTYDARGFFAWGARGRRENAWARVQL